jgi:hypothetical protein
VLMRDSMATGCECPLPAAAILTPNVARVQVKFIRGFQGAACQQEGLQFCAHEGTALHECHSITELLEATKMRSKPPRCTGDMKLNMEGLTVTCGRALRGPGPGSAEGSWKRALGPVCPVIPELEVPAIVDDDMIMYNFCVVNSRKGAGAARTVWMQYKR